MRETEKEVFDYVKRFPFNTEHFYEDRLVRNQRKMTQSEFQEAMNNLLASNRLSQPRPGYYELTELLKDEAMQAKPKMREMRPLKTKPKVLKGHVTIMRRRDVEGYECRNCHKFIMRPFSKCRLQKCPKCGKKTYYGKPALQKAYMRTERRTRGWRKIFEPILGRMRGVVNIERVGKPQISAAALPMPSPKPEAVTPKVIAAPSQKRKSGYRGQHVKRGSPEYYEVMHGAANEMWATRRKKLKKHVGKVVRQVTGFFRDKEKKVHPITVKTRARKQAIKPRSKRFKVKPKKKLKAKTSNKKKKGN
jgi:hypothetical protein